MEIEALGTGLTNLGEKGERAQLWVTSVLGRSGEQLLAQERCGADRNDGDCGCVGVDEGTKRESPFAALAGLKLVAHENEKQGD